MSIRPGRIRHYVTRAGVLIATISLVLLFPVQANAQSQGVTVWSALVGDPCCGIPDDDFKYMDANSACVGEVHPLPPDGGCGANNRDLRNINGPQIGGGCVWDTTCTCGTCGTLPNFPNGGNTQTNSTGVFTGSKIRSTCLFGALYAGVCGEPSKTMGVCVPGAAGLIGNPCNAITGNKVQVEAIYRSASGRLGLDLTYNGRSGAGAFRKGVFGKGWSSRYFARLNDTSQGIILVERANGQQLQFNAPQSGSVYVADADITDKLERITDASGTFVEWRLTASQGDEQLSYDAAGHLLRIRSRTGLDETLTYSTIDTPHTVAPEAGYLISVADPFGRQLSYTYDVNRHLATMTDPAGGVYRFEYDGPSGVANGNNLTRITFPDGKTRMYFYAEAAQINGGAACSTPSLDLPNALTGLQDENGARFATWTYDCFGRSTSTQHAGGADQYTITYNTDNRVIVDPLGTSRTMNVTPQRILGVNYTTGTTQPAASGAGNASNALSYDANGNIASRTNFNGNVTNYSYDLTRNLETSRAEAFGTPQARTITTQWHPSFRLHTKVAEPLRITTYVYNGDGGASCGFLADGVTLVPGVLCSKIIQPTSDATGAAGFGATPAGTPRTWTFTYNANGSVLTADGPRTDVSDVTTTTYYANDDADLGKRGNVATIIDALGHVTSIAAYNPHGQPLTIVDPNGMITNLAYDARLRLTSRNVGGETTTYAYDGVGQMTQVTLPDGSSLSYSYDAAHRMTGMSDNLGNRVAYTLDAMGNRTQEQVFDPANALAQTRSRVFNNLSRLAQDIGAQNQTTQYAYDNQGNVTSVADPLNHATANQYDALNRLIRVADPNLGQTLYGYNGIDQLVSVTDPRNLATTYSYDGLLNLNSQLSPDTGTTANTYDTAGNLLTQTDAKGQTTAYAYDALNRVTSITFADGSKQNYVYDLNTNGLGRLSSITELDPSQQATSVIAYAYDLHGRTASETRTINGVPYALGYAYDAFGRLSGLTYPSGRTVSYLFDSLGRIAQVNTTPPAGADAQVVASDIAYRPFGEVQSFSFGNGQPYTRGFDLDGRVSSYSLGARTFAIGYDAASRVSFISDAADAANTNTYSYDALDRLIGAVLPAVPFAYSYDAVGNRTFRTAGSSTDTYAYSATSNQIASITSQSGVVRSFVFDANGSTTDDGINRYSYDARRRMVQSVGALGVTTYQLNALGQRVRKSNAAEDRVFLYDTQGRLIAETDPGGGLKREYLYLYDIPLAVIQ